MKHLYKNYYHGEYTIYISNLFITFFQNTHIEDDYKSLSRFLRFYIHVEYLKERLDEEYRIAKLTKRIINIKI